MSFAAQERNIRVVIINENGDVFFAGCEIVERYGWMRVFWVGGECERWVIEDCAGVVCASSLLPRVGG